MAEAVEAMQQDLPRPPDRSSIPLATGEGVDMPLNAKHPGSGAHGADASRSVDAELPPSPSVQQQSLQHIGPPLSDAGRDTAPNLDAQLSPLLLPERYLL